MITLNEVFGKLKMQDSGALIAYVMGGDPKPDVTLQVTRALVRGGIDILEIGIPFSDPIADGPTIQAASTRALNAGTTPKRVLELAKKITNEYDVPLVVMTYYNPVFKMGLTHFFSLAKENGVSGVIIPDLPIDEADEYTKEAKAAGVDTIFLVAPSTSNQRIKKIIDSTSGFLYVVSRFGVTGTQSTVSNSTISLVKRVLPFTTGRVPMAVGFGVSRPEHVRSIIKAGSDGVIVGSAFVNIINSNQNNLEKMMLDLEETAVKLKKATFK